MSGLILLVIVGAWLAVLVPMALRSHDSGRSMATVDSFRDAMRVLARRDPLPSEGAQLPVQPQSRPRRSASGERLLFDDLAGSDGAVPPRPQPTAGRALTAGRAPVTAGRQVGPATAAGRRQLLLGLVGAALVLLVAGLLGPALLLAGHVLADLLVGAYVWQLRRQTVQRREQGRRPARPAATTSAVLGTPYGAARPASAHARVLTRGAGSRPVVRPEVRPEVPARVAGIPDRMPARVVPLEVVAAAAPSEQLPPPVRGAQGAPWQPVPVPLPGYVTAATAPRRVLDLTRPGDWSDGAVAAHREPGIDDRGAEPDDIHERRRASGGW